MTIVFDSSRLAELYLKDAEHDRDLARTYKDVVDTLNFSDNIATVKTNAKMCLDMLSDSEAVISWFTSQCKCNLRLVLERTCSYPELFDCHIAELSTKAIEA